MFDITSMLGNSNSGSDNSFGSFDFANYAAIKNGSYGKLVKSYYAGTNKSIDEQKASTAGKTDTAKAKAANDVDTTGLAQLKNDADKLKTSAEALDKDDLWKKTDGKEDMSKIAGAVKDFAAGYNKVIEQASKVSSKEVSQDVKFMTQMTDTFSKVLGKIGITVGTDGKLSVDEEKLKNADTNVVKSLFDGNATYGSQIADKAGSIARDADMNSRTYGSDATTASALSSVYNQFI